MKEYKIVENFGMCATIEEKLNKLSADGYTIAAIIPAEKSMASKIILSRDKQDGSSPRSIFETV